MKMITFMFLSLGFINPLMAKTQGMTCTQTKADGQVGYVATNYESIRGDTYQLVNKANGEIKELDKEVNGNEDESNLGPQVYVERRQLNGAKLVVTTSQVDGKVSAVLYNNYKEEEVLANFDTCK